MAARSSESLAARGAYVRSPPEMRDMERLDTIAAKVAVLMMILGLLLMSAIHT